MAQLVNSACASLWCYVIGAIGRRNFEKNIRQKERFDRFAGWDWYSRCGQNFVRNVFYFTGCTSLRFGWVTPYSSHVLFGCPKFEATTCLRQRPHCEWLWLYKPTHLVDAEVLRRQSFLLGQCERFDRFQGWGWCSQCVVGLHMFPWPFSTSQVGRLCDFVGARPIIRMFCLVVPNSKPQLVSCNGLIASG